MSNMTLTPLIFEFESYQFNPSEKRADFFYAVKFSEGEGLHFKETLVFPDAVPFNAVPEQALQRILQGLHLMLGISYYKTYCPKKISIPYLLSFKEAEFWNAVYKKGLGEFYYRNGLSLDNAPEFYGQETKNRESLRIVVQDRALLGIGGGKDSIVAAEALKSSNYAFTSFVVETQKASEIINQVVTAVDRDALIIKRVLDEQLFQSLPGAYNGHVPISAIIAWIGLLAGVLYGYKYVVVANEQSSNFGNVEYEGMEINHQWSKSSEFEILFQEYVAENITADVVYFSLLRQFSELRIAKLFTKFPQYFDKFSSCNRNFSIQKERPEHSLWCGECPKCAFAFLMFAAWMDQTALLKIFSKNLLEDRDLTPLFRDILGFGDIKPFDCVGAFDEAKAALFLASKNWGNTYIIRNFLPRIENSENLVKNSMRTVRADTIPTKFRFIGMEKVLILGYGKEGKVSERFIKKYYPAIEIGIADKTQGEDYLGKQAEYDIVVKTPGIPKALVAVPYVTGTNLFFAYNKRPVVIGVTGSKGKSTTASLIFAMLQQGGKSVRLAGNIGIPALETVLEDYPADEMIVLEMSSYQLDDCEFSPHIAVITNLFPEHMNYHGSETAYYQAKKRIIKFQTEQDFFVYNQNDKMLQLWADEVCSQAVPFDEAAVLPETMLLQGAHNKANIYAAATVAKLLGVAADKIKEAVETFRPLPHRLQCVGNYQGIDFYDDAISTTPESTIMAIRTVPNVKTILLGGEDRGYDFTLLEKEIREANIENVVLFPETGKRMLLSKEGLNVLETKDMREAVAFAYKYTPKGAATLLSCASPSYSLWKNFEEKGDLFQYWVKELGDSSKI
jgi:UDP-N-acetylmuramoylalanine--D-glutamate ligase